MKTVELPFGYYERGLDFAEHLLDEDGKERTVSQGLISWADQLSEMTEKLRKLAVKLEGKYAETDKDGQEPIITIEDSLADELLKEELVEEYDETDYEEEDEDYDEEEEGEEEEDFEEFDEDED